VSDHSQPLLEADAAADPFEQFTAWYRDAAAAVRSPEAMALGSVAADGQPSIRMVLLKAWSGRGFVFYTQYRSRKAAELDAGGKAALLFYWDELGRQVRIEGTVERVPDQESDEYFATRPFGAQISAHASYQSQTIADRETLDETVLQKAERYAGGPVPRPASWGGYRVRPQMFEFWQNRDDRLHDRLRYTPDGDGWKIERLQP
jgi:pyridoxamine 5'-phosphate oxidase